MNSGGVTRKLTTILAADVVGYSRLMAADEEATLATLRTYREIIFDLIGKHHGRVVGTAGDAVLAEFGSAVEAVRCGISIQEDLRVRNAELADDIQMHFRIGINVGDVMIEGDDLFGDGVNVAARLEGIAPTGGICISGSTFEQVKNKLSIGFEDMGPQEVKNIPQPVPAFRIVPASVSVTADAAKAGAARRWRAPAIAGAVALAVAAGGAAVWQFYPREATPLSSFPADFSTDTMLSKDIEALVTGMNIEGVSTVTDRPFTIKLLAGGGADVEFEKRRALAGTKSLDRGKWWADDYRFCMQFQRFGKGKQMCPTFVRKGETIAAVRGDGTPLQWALHK